VTSDTARKQTTSNKQQLDAMVNQLKVAQMALDQKKAADEAAKVEADKTSGVDEALKSGTPKADPLPPAQVQLDTEARAYLAEMNALRQRMDANASGLIGQIESEYAGLIRQQEEINKAYQAGITTEGYRSERARYAPLLQGQIIKGATDAGLQKIADLNVKKNRLILEAQTARDANSFKALQASMEAYRGIVKEEREVAQQTYENAVEASKAATEQLKAERQAEKDSYDYAETIAPSVAQEASQITDPAQRSAYILSVAQQIGLDSNVLFGEVQKYSDSTSPKVTTGIKEYEYAQEQGFKGSYLQYKQAIASATRAPKTENTLTAYEAANLGLPKTMVGMSESIINSQLNNSTPPNWFLQIKPGASKEDWDSFRFNIPTTGNTIENPFT
jgi:hypothetical protein